MAAIFKVKKIHINSYKIQICMKLTETLLKNHKWLTDNFPPKFFLKNGGHLEWRPFWMWKKYKLIHIKSKYAYSSLKLYSKIINNSLITFPPKKFRKMAAILNGSHFECEKKYKIIHIKSKYAWNSRKLYSKIINDLPITFPQKKFRKMVAILNGGHFLCEKKYKIIHIKSKYVRNSLTLYPKIINNLPLTLDALYTNGNVTSFASKHYFLLEIKNVST